MHSLTKFRALGMLRPVPLLLTILACGKTAEPDAYGNFEATEVVVSSESSGQLRWFTPTEGAHIAHGTVVAVVDTTQLNLEGASTKRSSWWPAAHASARAGCSTRRPPLRSSSTWLTGTIAHSWRR